MAEIATKLLAPRIVTKKRHAGHSWEYEERVRGSIYVEDGELEETSFIHCKTLDCDGRYVEDDFGFFKVTPDMFHVEERRTYDKTKTYLNYYLTEEGLDKLKEQGCPGLVVFDVVSRSQVKEKLNNIIVHAAALVKEQARLETLLNEES
jgi:hypothetical protein